MLSNAPKRESAPLPPQGRRVSAQYPTPHGQGRGLSDLPRIEIDGRWSGHGGFSEHLPLQAVLEPPREEAHRGSPILEMRPVTSVSPDW
jgi:hypothetical protein